jgi:hypothetical protein
MKYVYIGKKNQKNKNYVDYSLKYAPPTSTKALLPLHYIKFCVFPLHPTFLNLVLPPANCGRAQLGLGRSCHAAAGCALAPAGRNLPVDVKYAPYVKHTASRTS